MINKQIEKGLAEKIFDSIILNENENVEENYHLYLKYIRKHFSEYNPKIENRVINSYANYKVKETGR